MVDCASYLIYGPIKLTESGEKKDPQIIGKKKISPFTYSVLHFPPPF